MSDFGDSGFDPNAKENNEKGSVVPNGEYEVICVKGTKVPTRDFTGQRLNLDFQIVNGEFQNRHVFEGLNLWILENTDGRKTSVKIAKAQLSEFCRAVGIKNLKNISDLLNKPLIIKVKVKPETDEGPAQNAITSYKPRLSAPGGFTSDPVAPVPAVGAAVGDNSQGGTW